MNQSLRRCLGWTEELINEGKKALNYHVRVSDVKLGGRVLRRDEELEEERMEFEERHSHEDDGDEQEVEDGQEQQDVGDVMGLMSPWMRLGSGNRSRDESSDGFGAPDGGVGLGIEAVPGAESNVAAE